MTAPIVVPELETRPASLTTPVWHVVVHNDPVNLMSYVTMVFRKVFGYSKERATRHMLEVHHNGRSRVWSGDRERGEAYVQTLQRWQLTATLENER